MNEWKFKILEVLFILNGSERTFTYTEVIKKDSIHITIHFNDKIIIDEEHSLHFIPIKEDLDNDMSLTYARVYYELIRALANAKI